jgi:hypothetical protein
VGFGHPAWAVKTWIARPAEIFETVVLPEVWELKSPILSAQVEGLKKRVPKFSAIGRFALCFQRWSLAHDIGNPNL